MLYIAKLGLFLLAVSSNIFVFTGPDFRVSAMYKYGVIMLYSFVVGYILLLLLLLLLFLLPPPYACCCPLFCVTFDCAVLCSVFIYYSL
jgi:hypothetical protein